MSAFLRFRRAARRRRQQWPTGSRERGSGRRGNEAEDRTSGLSSGGIDNVSAMFFGARYLKQSVTEFRSKN